MLLYYNYYFEMQPALTKIIERVKLEEIVDKRVIQYRILLASLRPYESLSKLTLKVLSGSLFISTWNCYARSDDDYQCIYTNIYGQNFELFRLRGLHPVTRKVNTCQFNWIKFREIMVNCEIDTVGLTAFASLLSHYMFDLPNYTINKFYKFPMPITYMFVQVIPLINFITSPLIHMVNWQVRLRSYCRHVPNRAISLYSLSTD